MSQVPVAGLNRSEILDLLSEKGRCQSREFPTRWWFPTGPAPDNPDDTDYVQIKKDEAKAKRICGTCDVHDLCLTYALIFREIHGIWGGSSERQRRTMRRRPAEYVEIVSTTVTIVRRT